MKRYLLALLLALFTSCTVARVSPNPDYNYTPTNASSVYLYDHIEPNYPYLIIGVMTIDASLAWSVHQVEQTARKKAAAIGGDAVILANVDVNIYAFNRSVTTYGHATIYGDNISYQETTYPNATYVPSVILYCYIIKRK
jgi:hypothetical protein